MKVLTVTNLYPPYVIGGYEALCEENVEWLRVEGHDVRVLTSTHGVDAPRTEGHISRLLTLDGDMDHFRPMSSIAAGRTVEENRRVLNTAIREFRPDVILVWGMWHLNWSMLRGAESLDDPPVAYYLASPWPMESTAMAAYWRDPALRPLRSGAKRAIAKVVEAVAADTWAPQPLTLKHAICNSTTLRRQLMEGGYKIADAPIVCEGIDLAPYLAQTVPARAAGDPLDVLFVGRLGWHKGPHTVLEALAKLVNERGRKDVRVTLCGSGQSDYRQQLEQLVVDHNLAAYVTFLRPIPRAELPLLLGSNHVLVLSSIWEEALARIMQEAMAAGLAVVGTTTGTTVEYLLDDATGLTYPPGDATRLADVLALLADEPDLGPRLGERARALACDAFDVRRMNREIEDHLIRLVATRTPAVWAAAPEIATRGTI